MQSLSIQAYILITLAPAVFEWIQPSIATPIPDYNGEGHNPLEKRGALYSGLGNGRGYCTCYGGPGYSSPGYSSPGYGIPSYNGPGYGIPSYNGPGYGIPSYNGPGYGIPSYNGPGYGIPGYNGPGYGIPGYSGPGYGWGYGAGYGRGFLPFINAYNGYDANMVAVNANVGYFSQHYFKDIESENISVNYAKFNNAIF